MDVAKPITSQAWSHEDETALIMKLAAAQTGLSLTQASASVNTLTANFAEMVSTIHAIKLEAEQTPSATTKRILEHCEQFLDRVQGALVGFQFYDRMHQRLDHIARHLENTLQLVGNKVAINDPVAWQTLKEKIKTSYNIEEDRVLFEQVMQGIPVKEAVKTAARHARAEPVDKVELF
ncbi:MAG: hypothetical protein OEW08_05270 [Gammaproteobacteria bacterium]|nr:hypothetical protein [Gammaproteobacteria bacterium]